MKTIVTAHKVLISAAIALCALLTVWEIINKNLFLGLVFAAAGVAFTFYLRSVSRKYGGPRQPLPRAPR